MNEGESGKKEEEEGLEIIQTRENTTLQNRKSSGVKTSENGE